MYRRIFVALALSFVVLGSAGSAVASSGVAPTNLTIHSTDGQINGILTGRPACRGGQTIYMVVNGSKVANTDTSEDGRYAFTFEPTPPAEVYTRFDGDIVGEHPNTTVCSGSVSRVLRYGQAPPITDVEAVGGAVARSSGSAFAIAPLGRATGLALLLLVLGFVSLWVAPPIRRRKAAR